MSKEITDIISTAMASLGLEYAFMEYYGNANGKVVYPYFVGEYTETEGITEDGLQESTFLITGFTRGPWLDLENAKERIRTYFDPVEGLTAISDNGSGVAIFYATAFPVRKGDAAVKKIQINLSVKEWRVSA